MKKDANNTPADKLRGSIDQLQKNVEKVEFWAAALTGFAQPVPDYRPDDSAVLARHKLQSSSQDRSAAGNEPVEQKPAAPGKGSHRSA